MSAERVVALDKQTLELFALKGMENGGIPQSGNANGVKVRRVMQLIRDFSKTPFEQLRILDLACGEGVYAIEAALRGADVRALDARTERMNEGAKAAERLGLSNLRFEQKDVRAVTHDSHGSVDVVLFLGILYHLDQRDVFSVLQNLYELCTQFIIIDTHIALESEVTIEHNGRTYQGQQYREHAEHDADQVRKDRLLSSLDNPTSFWFTQESLLRLLREIGFTSVCQCQIPAEPFKPADRVTIIAMKGEPVQISAYPWVNGKTEDEIERLLAQDGRQLPAQGGGAGKIALKQRVRLWVNKALRPLGLKLTRI